MSIFFQSITFDKSVVSVLFIIHVLFLIVGIEMFCKIRGEFAMSTRNETKEKIDVVQAAHSRVGLFFQVNRLSVPTLFLRKKSL